MSTVKRTGIFAAVVIAGLAAGLVSTGLKAQDPKTAPGKDLFEQRCHTCHELNTVTVQRLSADDWRTTVQRMIMNGAQLTEPESEQIIAYLTKMYGPETSPSTASADAPAHP
jgi:mono/diheme cytochrome c family protein